MSESQVQAHWHPGFRRVLNEIAADDVTGLLGGYFYREFPRYYAGRRFAYYAMSQYSGGGGKSFPRGSVTRDDDGALNPSRVHACTSQSPGHRILSNIQGLGRREEGPARRTYLGPPLTQGLCGP